MQTPLGENQGRGIASGYWFNVGGETSCAVSLLEDGTIMVNSGTPDIGGSRASLCMMAAEEFGVDINHVRAVIPDTSALGFNRHTGGSRVTFAAGMMVVEASRDVITQLRERAALLWDIDADAVEWRDGAAHPAGDNAGTFEPLTLRELAAKTPETGGPVNARKSSNVQAPGPAFATHIVDVEVDRQTGGVKILRYTAIQDCGRAIHPSYVEGQLQGGAVQGIGWALNEEYVYDGEGRLQNTGFLDYRMPVASDLPQVLALHGQGVAAFEADRAADNDPRRRGDQSEQRKRGYGFAGAGLANDPEAFAGRHRKADAADSAVVSGADVKLRLQFGDIEKGFARVALGNGLALDPGNGGGARQGA